MWYSTFEMNELEHKLPTPVKLLIARRDGGSLTHCTLCHVSVELYLEACVLVRH